MNAGEWSEEDPLEEDHRARSNFVRTLVQRSSEPDRVSPTYSARPPRRIVHFWNDLRSLPEDVKECIESWKRLEEQGFELLLFDEGLARQFIRDRLGSRYERTYDICYHPAMQSDYFRLCYILMEGGCYVDADDVYRGAEIEQIYSDGRLKVQTLCYDISTEGMVPPSVFTSPGANSLNWIFYFNNNPLVAARGHSIIERALANATTSLERASQSQLPEIQSTTGPGNLTKAIFDAAHGGERMGEALLVLDDWEDVATSKWPLSYRNDERNWRLSNLRVYRG
jgi:hypothetical protein